MLDTQGCEMRRVEAMVRGHLGNTNNSARVGSGVAEQGKQKRKREAREAGWGGGQAEASCKPGCSEKSESDRPRACPMASHSSSAI